MRQLIITLLTVIMLAHASDFSKPPTAQEWQTIEVYREINEAELANLSPELTQNLITSGDKKFLKGEIDIFLREYSKPYLLKDGKVIRNATDTSEPFMWEDIEEKSYFYLHEPNMAYETWLSTSSEEGRLEAENSLEEFNAIKEIFPNYDAYIQMMKGMTKYLIPGEIWLRNNQEEIYCLVALHNESQINEIADGSYTIKNDFIGKNLTSTYILENNLLKYPSEAEYESSETINSLANVGDLPIWWLDWKALLATKVGYAQKIGVNRKGASYSIKSTTKEEIFGSE